MRQYIPILHENGRDRLHKAAPPRDYPVEPGKRDTLAELVDFYATAMEFAGVEPTHDQFGISLLPVLADKQVSVRNYAHSEGGRMAYEWQSDEYHATADTVATSPEIRPCE